MQQANTPRSTPLPATEPPDTDPYEIAYHGRRLRFDVRKGTLDADIVQEVVHNAYYEDARRWLTPGSVVVDVGGHIGSFTLSAAARGARVLAVEPVPENYALLARNARHNGFETQVTCLHGAAWSTTRTMEMRVSGSNTGGSSLCYGDDQDPVVTVQCYRLEDLLNAHGIAVCDLLKLDCEGSEFDILASLGEGAWQRINAVVMEYHVYSGPGRSLSQLQELLNRNGFVFMNTVPHLGLGLGYLLAVKAAAAAAPLPFITPTLAESPATRIPVIGAVWRAIRRSAHELVLFYVNQAVARYNQAAERNTVLTQVLAASHQRALRASRRWDDPSSAGDDLSS